MIEWKPICVLPNIDIKEPIDGGAAVLAPRRDRRVADLSQAHSSFKAFLTKFADAFGEKFTPTVLLV